MPRINNKAARKQERKTHLANILKAQRGIFGYTSEQMGKMFLRKGRGGYQNRIKDPGTTTLNELFIIAERLNTTVPELLGYKLDEKEKALI